MAEVAAPVLCDDLQITAIADVKTSVVVTKRSRAQFKTSELETCDDATKNRRRAASETTK